MGKQKGASNTPRLKESEGKRKGERQTRKRHQESDRKRKREISKAQMWGIEKQIVSDSDLSLNVSIQIGILM